MTNTNQASEDELREHLIKKLNTKKRMIEPHDERFVIGFQTEAPGDDVDWQYLDEVIMRFVNHFIRTEKLKLLAEVRERVVGEDERLDIQSDYDKLDVPHPETDRYPGLDGVRQASRNLCRGRQRAALTKLEAEL